MAKIISMRLLKPGIDPLPRGPIVFSRPAPLPAVNRSAKKSSKEQPKGDKRKS